MPEECADACRRLTTRLFKRLSRDAILYFIIITFFLLLFFVVYLPSRVYCPLPSHTRPWFCRYLIYILIMYIIPVRRPRGVQKLMSLSLFSPADKLKSRLSKSFARRRRRGDCNRQSSAAESLLRISYNYTVRSATGTCQTPITSIAEVQTPVVLRGSKC